MLVFGTVGLLTRHIRLTSGEVLPSGELAFCRAAVAVLLLGLYLLVRGKRVSLRAIGRELWPILLSGVAVGANWILLFEAYRHTTVAIATVSYYFAPTIVTIASFFLFRERMTPVRRLCFALSTVGIALVLGADALLPGATVMGVLLGLGAAVLYASVILLNKRITRADGVTRTFLQFVAATVTLLPYVLCTGGFHLGELPPLSLGLLAVLGVVYTGVAYCLYFFSVSRLPGQTIAVLSYLDPVIAVLGSVLLLRESMSAWQIAGSILIVGAAAWNECPPPRKTRKE